jgi:hypothetical protein
VAGTRCLGVRDWDSERATEELVNQEGEGMTSLHPLQLRTIACGKGSVWVWVATRSGSQSPWKSFVHFVGWITFVYSLKLSRIHVGGRHFEDARLEPRCEAQPFRIISTTRPTVPEIFTSAEWTPENPDLREGFGPELEYQNRCQRLQRVLQSV